MNSISTPGTAPTPSVRPTDLFGLSGRAALVTGGSKGLGFAMAKALASQGAAVCLAGRDESQLRESCAAISRDTGSTAAYVVADLSDRDESRRLASAAVAALGKVDILVNNAGIQHVEAVETFPSDKWEKILAINLSSVFYATRAAIPIMKAQGRGRIINVASAHGLVASPFKSAYVAAKHGVLGFTKTVALEVARDNITCNAICPGYVETPLVKQQIADQARTRGISKDKVVEDVMLAAQPTKKFVTTEELAGLFLYLVSDLGASANGASFSIDGGWTAQ